MKTLLLYYAKETVWDSCKDINIGFEKFYQHVFPGAEKYFAGDDPDSGKRLLEKVKDEGFRRIVVIDHRIRASKEFHYLALKDNLGLLEGLEVIYHLYGCFIDRIEEWAFLSKYFAGKNIKFVVGSSTYKKLVEKFFTINNVIHIPFPVEREKFKTATNLSKKDFGVSPQEKTFLYVGRVSPGKNVLALCEYIERLSRERGESCHLIIVGAIDDMGWPLESKSNVSGAMSFHFGELVCRINKRKKIIHYIPHTNDKNFIYGLYKLSDAVISLGTMRNEDYGMSLADAIGMRKKVVCSNWGGYKDFSKLSKNVFPIPVDFDGKDYFMSDEDVLSAMELGLSKEYIRERVELGSSVLAKKHAPKFSVLSGFEGLSKLGLFTLRNDPKPSHFSKLGQEIFREYYV